MILSISNRRRGGGFSYSYAVPFCALLLTFRAAMGFVCTGTSVRARRSSIRIITSLAASKANGNLNAKDKPYDCEVPLIFIHGMKGSHLSIQDNNNGSINNKRRAWLKPTALLNIPPRPDGHPYRDLSLPLSYSNDGTTWTQDRGPLKVDGMVDHIFEIDWPFSSYSNNNKKNQQIQLLPFYGHVTQYLQELQDQRVRPTASFVYDWRRSLPELSREFAAFVEQQFPKDQPVQVLAHSMGGLIAFEPMRDNPEKYAAGATLVGVPFGTGIQYLQDLHRGYYTELGRNRQFTPPSQFTMSSHWSFFPLSPEEMGDTFVDVSLKDTQSAFVPDTSAIGNPGTIFQETVTGSKIAFDFYNVEEWERNEVGIFDPRFKDMLDRATLDEYKQHMKIQLAQAKEWRVRALRPRSTTTTTTDGISDLVVCQTNTVPTLNQILRRKKRREVGDDQSQWEYDYISGRSVPGDGRIDFDKSFPPAGFDYKEVALESMHAKQMCWEESGGSFGTVVSEISSQLERYLSGSSAAGKAVAQDKSELLSTVG